MSLIFQKTNEKFDKFLPQNLKGGQINKVKALSYNTMIIWAFSCITDTIRGLCLLFDHFLYSGAEICPIFRCFFGKFRTPKKTF